MKFDSIGIINNVIPLMDKSVSNLNSAKNIILSINFPDDINVLSSLKNTIPKNISQIEDVLLNIKRWLNKKTNDMNKAERKNQQLFGNFTSIFYNNLSSQVNITSVGVVTGKLVKSTSYTELITGAKATNNVKSVFVNITEWFNNRWEDIKNIGAIVWSHTKSVLAVIANVLISIVKGIAQLVETLIDLIVMIGAGILSIHTGLYDAYQAINELITGKEWSSVTKDMWGGVMGFVAEDHVGSVVANWYKEGNWLHGLDQAAYVPFKSDGIFCQVGSGIGYIAGIIVLTITTLGLGGVAVGVGGASIAVSGAVIGSVTLSSTTASFWAEQRDKSWEGIERAFKNGEIDKETYESFKEISNMSDADWQLVENEYKAGHLTKEDYDIIKSIREMPCEWKTTESLFAGLKKGTWEGIKAAAITMITMGVVKITIAPIRSQLSKLIANVPKLLQPVFNKLIGDVVEDSIENTIQFTGEMIATGGSWSQSWDNLGGFAGLGLSLVMEIILNRNALPGGKKVNTDLGVNVLAKNKYQMPDLNYKKGTKGMNFDNTLNYKSINTFNMALLDSPIKTVKRIMNLPIKKILNNYNLIINRKMVINKNRFNVLANLILAQPIDNISKSQVDYIIFNILDMGYKLNQRCYVKFLNTFVDQYAKANNFNYKLTIKKGPTDLHGTYIEVNGIHHIWLNKRSSNFKTIIDNLDTIFHEFTHGDQAKNAKAFSFFNLNMSKDNLLWVFDPNYGRANYLYLVNEIDARLKANIYLDRYLRVAAPRTYQVRKNALNTEINNLQVLLDERTVSDLKFNSAIANRNNVFNQMMSNLNSSDLGKIFNKYPVLCVEYNPNGSLKTLDQLCSDKLMIMNQMESISLNQLDIDTFYTCKSVIETVIGNRTYTHDELLRSIKIVENYHPNLDFYQKEKASLLNLLRHTAGI